MQYVTFCVAPAKGTPQFKVWEILPGQEQFELFRRSVRSIDNQAQFVVITDSETSFGGNAADTQVVRCVTNTHEIMLERTRRQLEFLENNDFRVPIVFVDTDMLILASLSPVFDQSFDIAVSLRSDGAMPVNGGLFLVNNRQPKRSLQFFRELLERMETESRAERREWYGDQVALSHMLGQLDNRVDVGITREYGGFSILFLNSDTFNFSPPSEHPKLWQDLTGKYIYHFKGRCRAYMKDFWRLRVNPDATWFQRLPLARVLSQTKLELKRRQHKRMFLDDKRRKFD